MKKCECGCGEFTKLASKTITSRGWKKGKPLRFVNGHNSKLIERPNSKIKKKCVVCNNEFEVLPCRNNAVACSNRCGGIFSSRRRILEDGSIRYTSNGYKQIKMSNHPYSDKRGYIMYHRHVIEQYFGYYLSKDYDVHHIDENIENNEISNLSVLTRSVHMSIHARKRKFWEMSPR